MASILRSGKFFRFFTNVTRNIGLNNANHRESDTLLCSRRNEWDIKLHRYLLLYFTVGFVFAGAPRDSRLNWLQLNGKSKSFICRSLATIQIAQLNLGDGQAVSGISATSKVDRSIYRADIDITKTGRVARKDIENIIEEIKEMSESGLHVAHSQLADCFFFVCRDSNSHAELAADQVLRKLNP